MTPLELGREMYATLHDRLRIGYVNGARRGGLMLCGGDAGAYGEDVGYYEAIHAVNGDDFDLAFARGMRDMLTEVGR